MCLRNVMNLEDVLHQAKSNFGSCTCSSCSQIGNFLQRWQFLQRDLVFNGHFTYIPFGLYIRRFQTQNNIQYTQKNLFLKQSLFFVFGVCGAQQYLNIYKTGLFVIGAKLEMFCRMPQIF